MTVELQKQAEQSVVYLPDAKKGEGSQAFTLSFFTTERKSLLAPYGAPNRDWQLLQWYRQPANTKLQSAFAGLAKKIKATPWEITGGRNLTRYFQDVLREGEFGSGWGDLIALWVLDYLRFDRGGTLEVIAAGASDTPIRGPVYGLTHLDALRLWPTGDPEYPILYYPKQGGEKQLMHHSRVLRLVDMSEGYDTDFPGFGLCALSRAMSIVEREFYMGRYIREQLDELPPPGIVVASNVSKSERDAAAMQYKVDQSADVAPPWGKQMWLFGLDPSHKADLEAVSFSQAPEKFDYNTYVQIDINELALAIGVDVQELWQLSGGNIGSGQQSQILHAKSQGKTPADLYSGIERNLNNILPESLEFTFKVRDPYEAQERAQTAQLWSNFVLATGDSLTADEKRRLLANQVEAVYDAITDAQGNIARLNDVDVVPVDAQSPITPAPQQTVADDSAPLADSDSTTDVQMRRVKAYSSTAEQFAQAVEKTLRLGSDGYRIPSRIKASMRRHLKEYGEAAYLDGLKAGGAGNELDDEDRAEIVGWLADQTAYLDAMADDLFKADLSDEALENKARLWANKSLYNAHLLGLASADRNSLYRWELGATETHCKTCLAMNGKRKRLRTWLKGDILPKSDKLACGGWNCDCDLVKAT